MTLDASRHPRYPVSLRDARERPATSPCGTPRDRPGFVDEIRFYIDRLGTVTGPVTDDAVRDALRDGALSAATARMRVAGTELWASPRAFATLARVPGVARTPEPTPPTAVACDLAPDLAAAPQALRDLLLFWLHEGTLVFGPLSGQQLRLGFEAGQYRDAAAMVVDSGVWCRASQIAVARDSSSVAAAELAREPSVPGAVPAEPGAARRPQRALYAGAAAAPPLSAPLSSRRQGVLPSSPRVEGSRISASGQGSITVRCAVCLERIPAGLVTCPECGEGPLAERAPPSTSGSPSIPDDIPGQSALAMHWRPIVTLGAIVALVCTGIALRHLAPGRFLTPPRASNRASAAMAGGTPSGPAAGCSAACWNGESCQAGLPGGSPQTPGQPGAAAQPLSQPGGTPQSPGHCVWQPPNDVGHIAVHAEPTVGGPFALPRDVSDALPLDGERFAVSLLTGIEVYNARTGGVLSLVTDAPQSRRLYRVGKVVYATAPQRIYVVAADTTRLLKTIETGATVGEITVGASGRRALASLPSAHAVAVLATEFHAEIDRIQFGDDAVGPMGFDDTGKRALTTTGGVPLPGLPQPQGGAAYAFDPSRLASAQDRVRASMVGNPVSVLMTPDGEHSYVVLRAEDALVPLEWLPSGAVRQEARIPTCHEPEQIELVRRGRLGVVRCNEGRAIEIFDLARRELVRHVPFNARVADLAIAPDGKQAIVALPAEGAGFVGIVDLETWAVKVLPVGAEPTRVRLSPDGSMALVLSDRAKVAWVIR